MTDDEAAEGDSTSSEDPGDDPGPPEDGHVDQTSSEDAEVDSTPPEGAESDQTPPEGTEAGSMSSREADPTPPEEVEAGPTSSEDSEADPDSFETDTEGGHADGEGVAGAPATRPTAALPPDRRVEAPIGAVDGASLAEAAESDVPADVRKYDRFKKVDGAQYERVNEFLRERTYITAREWAIARLCSDFRTETGVEMTKIGENLPHLVPFMTDSYSPQAVNQARSSFEEKVRKAGATFLYGAMSDFFSADELDDLMYEVTEVAKFLLEVEGVDLAVDEELEGEERISSVMREVRSASDELRHEGTTCPHCGREIGSEE